MEARRMKDGAQPFALAAALRGRTNDMKKTLSGTIALVALPLVSPSPAGADVTGRLPARRSRATDPLRKGRFVPDGGVRASLLRRVDRLLPGLLSVSPGHPRHVQLRLRQLQGHVLHGGRGAPRSVDCATDDRHGHGLRAAQVRASLDRRLSARHVRLVLRRGVESEHLR